MCNTATLGFIRRLKDDNGNYIYNPVVGGPDTILGYSVAENPAMASRKGAEETANMLSARVGRATYLSADQLQGNKDPGAEAVAKLFEYLVGRGGS
mgnify:CR=1 FL=1